MLGSSPSSWDEEIAVYDKIVFENAAGRTARQFLCCYKAYVVNDMHAQTLEHLFSLVANARREMG